LAMGFSLVYAGLLQRVLAGKCATRPCFTRNWMR
jgi:hypothetical protein